MKTTETTVALTTGVCRSCGESPPEGDLLAPYQLCEPCHVKVEGELAEASRYRRKYGLILSSLVIGSGWLARWINGGSGLFFGLISLFVFGFFIGLPVWLSTRKTAIVGKLAKHPALPELPVARLLPPGDDS